MQQGYCSVASVKMALCFKPQFGASELSDISGFVELPDGKVVSGTECPPQLASELEPLSR